MGVQTLPTGVFGSLPAETCGLLLGRSSTIVKELQSYPGVIDNDYEGEIKIMAASLHGIITIPANQRIAQLSSLVSTTFQIPVREDRVALVPLLCTGFNLLLVRDLTLN